MQTADVPVPQILKEVAEVVKAVNIAPQDWISETICEQIVDAPDEPFHLFQEEIDEVIKLPPTERILERTVEHIVHVPVPQTLEEVVEVVKAVKFVPQERVHHQECRDYADTQYIDNVATVFMVIQRQVLRPSLIQVTKNAEFLQTQCIDKVVVEMPVVMQRKVPQIRTVLKTVEIPRAKFVGRVVEAPVIMQMCQCRLSRSRSASRRVYTNRPSTKRVTKHVEIPRGRRPT